MKITVKDAGPCRKQLNIEVPAERMAEELEKILAVYTKKAKIPGFRPGRAPAEIVRKKFAKEIAEDLKDHMVPQAYHEAVKEKALDVVAVMGVENVTYEAGKPLTFQVTFDVPPEFKLPKYRKISIKGEKVGVDEGEVNKALDEIRSQFASFNDVEDRPVKEGDLVQVDYSATLEGKPLEEIAPEAVGLGKGGDFWTLADKNAFLPGFAAGLTGCRIGEDRDIEIEFPDDFTEKSVAGRKAIYHVTVKAIREKNLPKVDEEFLKRFEVDSEEALRLKIREDLEQMAEQRETNRRKNEIVTQLLKGSDFDLPESVVQEETRNTIYDLVRQNTARGISKGQIEEQRGQIFETAAKSAKDKVKFRYILHRIADEEKIAVSDEDVAQYVERMAAAYGMAVPAMSAELEKKNAMDNIREDLRIQKTLDFLLTLANVKE